LKEIARKLNLSVNSLDASGLPVGINIYKNSEDKYFATDVEHLLPPQAVMDDKHELLYNKLRATYITRIPMKLRSDSFSPTSGIEDDQVATRASSRLFTDLLPDVAWRMSNEPELWEHDLISSIHKEGLCCRHLGFLRSMCTSELAKHILLTEIVARTLKNEIREVLRKSLRAYKSPSDEPYKEAIFQFLQPVLSYQTPAPTYFEISEKTDFFMGDADEAEQMVQGLEVDIAKRRITRDGTGPEYIEVEANNSLPIPWRQSTFFMEIKFLSSNDVIFGLCGVASNKHLMDAHGYCLSLATKTWVIQGKHIPCNEEWEVGDVLGVFYSWRSKELLFTKNTKIVYMLGIARGAFIPKIMIGRNTQISFTFGPRFVFDVEELCYRLHNESPIKPDEGMQFWQQALKTKILARYSKSLSEEELQSHVSLRAFVGLSVLANRVEELSGLTFSDRVHSYMADPTATFNLVPYDIVGLSSKVKAMELYEFSSGCAQLIDVLQRSPLALDKETESLMNSARSQLDHVYASTPILNAEQYYYIAQAYHQGATRLIAMEDDVSQEEALMLQERALEIYDEAVILWVLIIRLLVPIITEDFFSKEEYSLPKWTCSRKVLTCSTS